LYSWKGWGKTAKVRSPVAWGERIPDEQKEEKNGGGTERGK